MSLILFSREESRWTLVLFLHFLPRGFPSLLFSIITITVEQLHRHHSLGQSSSTLSTGWSFSWPEMHHAMTLPDSVQQLSNPPRLHVRGDTCDPQPMNLCPRCAAM